MNDNACLDDGQESDSSSNLTISISSGEEDEDEEELSFDSEDDYEDEEVEDDDTDDSLTGNKYGDQSHKYVASLESEGIESRGLKQKLKKCMDANNQHLSNVATSSSMISTRELRVGTHVLALYDDARHTWKVATLIAINCSGRPECNTYRVKFQNTDQEEDIDRELMPRNAKKRKTGRRDNENPNGEHNCELNPTNC